MSAPQTTVPSEFQRLDTDVVSKNESVDVRTMQRLVSNHNMLLARRLKRSLFHHNFRNDTDGAAPAYFGGLEPTPTGIVGAVVAQVPLLISPATASVVVDMHALKTSVGNVDVYGVLTRAEQAGFGVTGVHVTSLTKTAYSFSVPLYNPAPAPPEIAGSIMMLTLVCDGLVDTSNIKTGTLTAVTADTATGSFAGSDVGNALVITGDLSIEPRMIKAVDNNVARLSRPWNRIPVVGASYAVRAVSRVGIFDLSVYEYALSTFAHAVGSGWL